MSAKYEFVPGDTITIAPADRSGALAYHSCAQRTGGRPMTPLSLRRFPRTAGAAFKDADYAQAFWPHEPEPVGFWSAVSYWPALILCIAAFALFTGCAGPSDTETLQATADSVDDAIAQAVVTAKARTK